MNASAAFQSPWNFLGLPAEKAGEDAKAWILPIPYEGTTSYGAGTRGGPAAILAASRQVELFDREFAAEAALLYGIHTLPPLGLVHRSPEAMTAAVAAAVGSIVAPQRGPRLLGVFGGEHSLSAGVARGLAASVGDELVCVQIDAHADLRAEYEGSPYSHACAARRIAEVCPLFQIGIRNISAEEEAFRRQSDRVTTFFAEESDRPAMLDELAAFVRDKSVYLTVDLDGLDPAIMPAVGTPEPGGLSWQRTLDIVRCVAAKGRRLIAFDLVELAPIPAVVAPDFLAARLAYKIASYGVLGVPA